MANSSRAPVQLNVLTPVLPTTRSDIALVGGDVVVGSNSNGFGIRTISANAPLNTQGSDGDIWYQV